MIWNNVSITLEIIKSKNTSRNVEGIVEDEDNYEYKTVYGELREVRKLEHNSPAAQPIDGLLGIKYSANIDKDATKVIVGDNKYRIINIKPSSHIQPNWKILELKQVYE